jgi:hypothetical protein
VSNRRVTEQSGVVRKAQHRGVAVFVSAASAEVQRMLIAHGVTSPLVQVTTSLEKRYAAREV